MSQSPPAVVLLVEDDSDHAELVSRALAGQDAVRLVHVWNGRDALEYLHRNGVWADPETSPRPDLVLLDLRLPGLNGGEVLRRIRASQKLQSIPVVILSTSEVRGEVEGSGGAEADQTAVKPMDGTLFRGLVRELVTSWTTGAARRREGFA